MAQFLSEHARDPQGVKVPRRNDYGAAVALYFTDYFPRIPGLKFSCAGILMDGLSAGQLRAHDPRQGIFPDRLPTIALIWVRHVRCSPLRSRRARAIAIVWRHFKAVWLGLDCLQPV